MDLEKYADAKKQSIKKVRKSFAISVFKGIVEKTPVDTGRARGNWQITIGQDSTKVLDRKCKNGENITEESQKVNEVNGDETIYISNNLPYISKLEYGGYVSPVKKGTWKKGKGYEVRSANGFSKQAPQGMVGLTLANMERFIKKAIKDEGL